VADRWFRGFGQDDGPVDARAVQNTEETGRTKVGAKVTMGINNHRIVLPESCAQATASAGVLFQ
jgi:hypothetical protein